MDFDSVFFAAGGLFVAGIVKGATGIGYSSCALPFLVAALGLKPAIMLLVVPAMASNIAVLATTGSLDRALKRFWPLYLATLPGIAAGIAMLMWADNRIPARILGLVIAAYVVLAWLQPPFQLSPRLARMAQLPVGLLNGLLTGFTGSQVMPLMPYMMAQKLDTSLFVQAVNVAVVIASAFLGLGLIAAGAMSASDLGLSGLAAAPALLGVYIGTWSRRQIPAGHFRSLVLAVLLLIGVSLFVGPNAFA
jgi:uncharacterized protein